MSILGKDLYGSLISTRYLGQICSQTLNARGGFLEKSYALADSSTKFLCSKLGLPYAEKNGIRCLTMASYHAYIPYGEAGYEYLQSKMEGKRVPAIRYERLQEAWGEKFTNLTDEGKEYIRLFFEGYDKDELDLSRPEDGVALICRAHSRLDAHYDPALSNEHLITPMDLGFWIGNLAKEGKRISAKEVLDKIPPYTLTEKDKAYIDGWWF